MYSKIFVLAFFSTLFALVAVATPHTQFEARQDGSSTTSAASAASSAATDIDPNSSALSILNDFSSAVASLPTAGISGASVLSPSLLVGVGSAIVGALLGAVITL